MTYYQKKRVLAKLHRIQNHVKYQELGYGTAVVADATIVVDRIIRLHINEPCDFHCGKPLPRRIWREKK